MPQWSPRGLHKTQTESTRRMPSSGMLRHVERPDVSEEISASIIRGTRIGELGTALSVTSNRSTLRRLLVTANFLTNLEVNGVTIFSMKFYKMRYDDVGYTFLHSLY
jgi:hypothetical protein